MTVIFATSMMGLKTKFCNMPYDMMSSMQARPKASLFRTKLQFCLYLRPGSITRVK
jgi:hypothetical protein